MNGEGGSVPTVAFTPSGDVPLFPNTEAAMAYGRELRRHYPIHDLFHTLVRTWMVSQLAFDNASNPQARANLAYRVQTLREAVRGFLFDDEDPRARAAATPAHDLDLAPDPQLAGCS